MCFDAYVNVGVVLLVLVIKVKINLKITLGMLANDVLDVLPSFEKKQLWLNLLNKYSPY